MKKCPYCAKEIQDAAIFCRYCHRDLPEAGKTKKGRLMKYCPQCGKKISNNAQYCAYCYTDLHPDLPTTHSPKTYDQSRSNKIRRRKHKGFMGFYGSYKKGLAIILGVFGVLTLLSGNNEGIWMILGAALVYWIWS